VTRAVLAGFGVCACVAIALAQDQQPRPVFRSAVDLIHFDVSVLDRDRKPVRGLTASDFTVLEDDKPQPVTAFAAIDVPPPAPAPAAAWLRDVSPDVHTNEFEELPDGRLFVIVIDDALIPADPFALQSAKKIARGVVDRAGPHDRIAIVFTFASRNSQDYTTDRAKLYAAIETLVAGPARHTLGWDQTVLSNPRDPESLQIPIMDPDTQLRSGTLRTLLLSAESLIAAPQRRKALIFISPGVSVDVMNDARPAAIPRGGGHTMAIREANRDAVVLMSETFKRLAAANVTMYPVDPFGLHGLQNYVGQIARGFRAFRRATQPVPADFNWLVPSGQGAPRPEDLVRHKSTLDMDFLMSAASNTGGRAIVNTNEFDTGLDAIFEENASYYLIGYARPQLRPEGYLHKLKVTVNRPGVTVRTRSGYEAGTPAGSSGPAEPDRALSLAAAGPVASSALPLQLSLAPVSAANPGDDARVAVVLGIRQPPATVRTTQTLRVQVAVYTPDGIAVGKPQMQTATLAVVPGSTEVRYEVLTERALKPGRYTFRVSAHRGSDGLAGSVYTDVVVPHFREAALSASGVFVHVRPGVTAIPREGLPALVPVIPTAIRDFSPSDDVRTFFRVYQGGRQPPAAVPLAVRIVNERDDVIASANGVIAAERFGPDTRAADHQFSVPVAAMPPGRYLIRFELGIGSALVKRDVIIRVR
jgi:VWFA-related protein